MRKRLQKLTTQRESKGKGMDKRWEAKRNGWDKGKTRIRMCEGDRVGGGRGAEKGAVRKGVKKISKGEASTTTNYLGVSRRSQGRSNLPKMVA